MRVKAVVATAVPAVFHHHVLPVVGKPRDQIRVDDHARGDRPYLIERFATFIALERPDIDAFVQTGVNNSSRRFNRVANESILTTFPRCRFYPFVIALDILIKLWPVSTINRIVVCWEGQ